MGIFEAGCVVGGVGLGWGKKEVVVVTIVAKGSNVLLVVSYFWKSGSCCRCICHIHICLKGDST